MSEREQRERLVELLKQTCHCKDEDCSNCSSNGICFTYKDADHLLENGVANAKYEAIKEFAERLKIKVKMYNSEDVDEGDLIDDLLTVGETVEIIDNLVKEMTEVEEVE